MAFPVEHHANAAAGRFTAQLSATRDRAGSLAGEQVQVKSQLSLLESAREEISAYVAIKSEAKTLKQRKVGAGPAVRRMKLEQVQAYLDAARRFPDPRAQADLARRMQASVRPRDVVERGLRQPAHQFAMLQFALDDALRRSLPSDVTERLQEALDELVHEHGEGIQAGLNTIQVAADFAADADGIDNFQQAYTDVVLGEKTLAQTLLVVLQRLSGLRGQDFERGLKALLSALGADLSAASPSREPVRLQALVQDVYQLEVASSVLESCKRLSSRIAALYGIETVEPLDFMQALVTFTGDRWVLPARMLALAQAFQVAGLPVRLTFYAGLRDALHLIPTRVFADLEARNSVLGSAQEVYDRTVAEEEERQERQRQEREDNDHDEPKLD